MTHQEQPFAALVAWLPRLQESAPGQAGVPWRALVRATAALAASAPPLALGLGVAALELSDQFKLRQHVCGLLVHGAGWPWAVGMSLSGPLAMAAWWLALLALLALAALLAVRLSGPPWPASGQLLRGLARASAAPVGIAAFIQLILLGWFAGLMAAFGLVALVLWALLATAIWRRLRGGRWRWLAAGLALLVLAPLAGLGAQGGLALLRGRALVPSAILTPGGEVRALAFDGQSLLVVSDAAPRACLALARDGRRTASWASCPARQAEAIERAAARAPYGGAFELRAATVDPGAALAEAREDGTLRLRRADGDLVLAGHRPQRTRALALSPDGWLLASAGTDNAVRLWRVADGALHRTLYGHTDDVLALAFAADGRTLASGGVDGSIRLWVGYDPPRGEALR